VSPFLNLISILTQFNKWVCRIARISAQVTQLLDAGAVRNARLWPALVYPDPLLSRPMARAYSHNSVEEVQLCLENVRPSWVETPGAMQLLIERVSGEKPKYDATFLACLAK
jgi:hypothetical protein